jgi:hypothetical protein
VEGDLDSGRAANLQIHAAGCPPCESVLDGARAVFRELNREASLPAPPPPAHLATRIMGYLPDASPRQRLWIAAACSAGMVAAAALFITVLARLLPTGGGRPLLPGLRAGLDTATQWLAPFGNLLNTLGGLPGIPSGPTAAAGSSVLPALGLIAAGLLGLATVLTLSASRPVPSAGRQLTRTP